PGGHVLRELALGGDAHAVRPEQRAVVGVVVEVLGVTVVLTPEPDLAVERKRLLFLRREGRGDHDDHADSQKRDIQQLLHSRTSSQIGWTNRTLPVCVEWKSHSSARRRLETFRHGVGCPLSAAAMSSDSPLLTSSVNGFFQLTGVKAESNHANLYCEVSAIPLTGGSSPRQLPQKNRLSSTNGRLWERIAAGNMAHNIQLVG